MADDQSEVSSDGEARPLDAWVDQKADELGVERGVVFDRAMVAARVIDDGIDAPPADAEVTPNDERVQRLERRVGSLEDGLETKITDVRERVVQVKRETDAKAPTDHEHQELLEATDRAVEAASSANDRVDEIEESVDSGFENYESVLEYLAETSDDLSEKLDTVARAIVELRSRATALESTENIRAATDALRAEANRHGETKAKCGDCGATLQVGLLTSPSCPHCGASFVEFEPASGFLRSATLVAGDRPALEGDEPITETVTDLFDEEADG